MPNKKPGMSGSGFSSVGDHRIYEDGDQRKVPVATFKAMNKTHEHNILEGKDRRPEKQTELYNQVVEQDWIEAGVYSETEAAKRDPTAPATLHGNKPSRGAQIDKELMEEDAAILKKKGDAMPGKKY
ncbi:hypothetical protein CONLIGDRAFT_630755 [Coniochaeta ligniaria NRRL 30616]|uniref:Uncharacterized protein n=1 Tax=Coniochaeta ligniaria NRRL 30616 TaxID=1408157 RepID=A0A1J7IUJ3_9PEZI|nr:hypothetical protein CONLIGDRAFT_630755 [Coniochaeta ligniaria NRRL 30616]